MKTILTLLILMFGSAQQPIDDHRITLDEEFTIKNGEQVIIQDQKLTLKFSSIFLDSRCPSDVVCGWPGNGAIVIEVNRKKKKALQAMLNTLLDPKGVDYKGYRIRLLELNPYPKAGIPINPADYEARLIVTRTPEPEPKLQ